MKPFAIDLYERFIRGESVEHLAAVLGIPVERIAARIRAAGRHLQEQAARRDATRNRLAEGAAILEHRCGWKAREREIVGRELRELEQDVLADPGALAALLVPVRPRKRRNEPER